MSDHTVALYCIVDDLLKAVGDTDDAHRAMTDAEVLPLALPEGSELFMYSGYTDYEAEDVAGNSTA